VAADVGIVAAMSMEVGFLLDGLRRRRKYSSASHDVIEGEHDGKLLAVVVGGVGRPRARAACEILYTGHRPRWIVSAGFGGALDPGLKRHDVVLPREILTPEGERFEVVQAGAPTDLSRGRLLTVDSIVRTANEKAALRERFDADVVDMETSAVAEFCSRKAVRFVALRVVSDEAGIDLPKEVIDLITRSGSYRMGSALRAIWNRPSSLKDLWRLHEQATEAADRLAKATLRLISSLPG
jgi:adenosylhomocysteine nucleosidase